MINWLQWALMGLLVGGLILMGWVANGWRMQALEAVNLRRDLRHEIQRRVTADAERLALTRQLVAAEGKVTERIKVVKQTVTKHVPANADCDLPEPVAGQLQRLRSGGDVPSPTAAVAGQGQALGPAR